MDNILFFLLFILLNSQLFITFTPFNLILLTKAWINFSVFKAASSSEKTILLFLEKLMLDSYVEAVDTDLDKEHIKVELRKLYTEAQNLEVV